MKMERTRKRDSKTRRQPKRKPQNLFRRRSLVGKILPLFIEHPFSVKKNLIANVYSQKYGKSISLKQHGFKNLVNFYKETNIFDDLDNGLIKVSREKLLDYLVKPLIGLQDPESSFSELNSFPHQILLNFCNAPSLDALIREVTQTQIAHRDSLTMNVSLGSLGSPSGPFMGPPPVPLFSPKQSNLLPTTSATNTPLGSLGSPRPFMGLPPVPLFSPKQSNLLPTTSAMSTPLDSSGSTWPAVPLHFPMHSTVSPITSFPNNGILPKDEGYLPPLPGHPRLDLPTIHETAALKPPSRPVAKPGEHRKVVVERVQSYIKEVMIFCSKQGKHLPVNILTTELDTVIHAIHNAVGLRISQHDIKAWDNFDRLYKRLDVLIRNFCWQCPFTSVYELQRTIVEFEKVPSFDDLLMGPILKHPLIQEFFKVPDGLMSVPEITTYDILITLNEYFKKCKGFRQGNLDDFMDFFAKKFNADSPEFLCVRICDFEKAKSSEQNFRKCQTRIRNNRTTHCKMEIFKAINLRVESLQSSLQELSLKEYDLIHQSPADIVKGVFKALQEHFPAFIQPKLLTFIDTVLQDCRLRKLFTIAVYQSAYGVQQYVQEHERTPKDFCHVQQSELLRVIAELLKCEQFPINLSSLADVEESLLQRYSVNSFSCFSWGSFLRFVAQDEELVKCIGGRHIGSSDGNSDSFQRNRVLGFVNQVKDTSDTEFVSSALKDQFSVQNVEDLSCGVIEKLISDAGTQRGTTRNSSSIPFIAYTVPLVRNEQPLAVPNNPYGSSHGLLGPQSSENAYARLSKAPLLTNLSEWMQWDLIYAPSLGPLGDFLTKQHQSRCETPIHALYDSSNRFLKIDPNSKRKDFENAVDEFDPIGAAGHLVSMAVNEASVHLMPLQLLARCVVTKLELIEVFGDDGLVSESFVFRCLLQIPLELCDTLGKQVFLDPLRKVKSVESVNSLLQLCETSSQRCFFQALGLKLGINNWINDFKEMEASRNTLTSSIQSLQSCCKEERFPNVNEWVKPSAVSFVPFGQSKVDTSNNTQNLIQPSYGNIEILTGEAKTIIDKIRQEEFGLHLQLTEEQLKISNKQKERESRSLQCLSQELYSEDTHFVLELIQNADDNTYILESSVPPTVKFVLHKDCVTVLNNEVGFSEENIRAICDVGKSTKGPLQSGYIGQKGIGFKSVFRITSTPEIHSNNFHIRFDTSSDPIGYILPEWINDSYIDNEMFISELSKWTTCIVLPMKPESSSRSTVKKFQDIQPSLLLFLNRLRSIIIHDMESGEVRTMVRQDMGEGVTVITHNKGMDCWLVARKELEDACKYKSGVRTTEIAIAFPLSEDSDARVLQSQQVFAYLPLRSYGFRFIIQGDFDLPSSREGVKEDSSWNQWLREMIPSLFVEALENIKALSQLSIFQAISLFVQFIPLEGEVHDFFKPVAGHILRLLRTSEWLPTECTVTNTAVNEGIDFSQIIELMMTDGNEPQIGLPYETHSVAFKQPSQLVMVPQDLIRKYIPQSILATSLNLYYLHPSLVSRISPDLCSHLGITTMTLDHLIDIAKSVLDSYHSDNQSNSSIDIDIKDYDSDGAPSSPFNHLVSWIAHWLACVYTILEETGDISSSSLLKLKKLHIIPLMDESLVALDSVIVFFSPSLNKSDADIKKYEKLYKQLKLIHSNLLVSGDQVVGGKVYEMLSARLGVKELNPLDIVYYHIIPGFSRTMKIDENIAFMKFIKENLDQCSERQKSQVIEKLKECVSFVTSNNELKSPHEECIRFSTQYKDQWDLSTLFPEVKWTLVSSKYLENSSNVKSWRSFFQTLGIKGGKLLLIERFNHTVETPTRNKQASLWDVSDWKRSQDGLFIVRDYYSREFVDIIDAISSVKNPSQKYNQLLALSRLIDSEWDSEYSKCFMAEYYNGSNEVRLGEVISSFGKSIRDKAWLPTMNVNKDPHPIGVMMKGVDLYEHTKCITDLLDNHVPYLCFQFKSHDLLEKLQVKSAISEATLLEHLQCWSASQSTFVTSIDHMKHVYAYLARNKEFLDDERFLFGCEKLIYFPTQFRPPHEKGTGEFVAIHNCCWEDKTGVLCTMLFEGKTPPPNLPRILSFFYSSADEVAKSEMKHAFIQLGVEKLMKLSSLIDLFELISFDVPRPTSKHAENFRSIAEAVIGAIYEHTDQGFVRNECKSAFFKDTIKKKRIFPTTNKKWSNLKRLFCDDNSEISKLFSESNKVRFLDWTPNEADFCTTQPGSTSLQKFIEICDIPLLGENYQKSLVPGIIQPFHELQRLFHNIVPLIQLYCLSLEQSDKRTLEYQCGMFNILQKLNFFSTIELSCTYSVGKYSLPAISLRQCQLQFNDSSANVYGVVNSEGKYVEKISLVEVLQELFEIEKGNTRSYMFLASLIFDEPSSERDKMAVRKTFNLEGYCMDVGSKFPFWQVELPEIYLNLEEKASNEGNEQAPMDGNGDIIQATPSSITCTSGIASPSASDIAKPCSNTGIATPSSTDIATCTSTVIATPTSSGIATPTTGIAAPSCTPGIGGQQQFIEHGKRPLEDPVEWRQSQRLSMDPSTWNYQQKHDMPQKPSILGHYLEQSGYLPANSSLLEFHNTFDGNTAFDIDHLMQSIPIDLSQIPQDKDRMIASGRWGEWFAYHVLKGCSTLPGNEHVSIVSVKWVNADSESGLPYDIEVCTDDNNTCYIEVKSTTSSSKELIPFSWKELKFAKVKSNNYGLVRVYNSLALANARVHWLQNLYKILKRNQSVTVYLKL